MNLLKLTFLASLLIAVGGIALVVLFLRGLRNMRHEIDPTRRDPWRSLDDER